MKFALGLAKHGKVPPPFPPHVADEVEESRALYDLVKEQGRDGALGIVQGEHALERIEFHNKSKEPNRAKRRGLSAGTNGQPLKVAYYKGCLASLSAKELDISTQALAPKVGIELEELESVTCCGAGDIHEAEPDYYLHLNARILAYAEATGCDTLMTVCNVCTLNLRQANYQLQIDDDAARARQRKPRGRSACPRYSGKVEVLHFLWLVAGSHFEQLKAAAHKGLSGLKIAPFYGCQILRPSKLLGFDDPDKPESLERIIEACGGEAIDYPAKIKCCGFPIIQAREQTALGELIQPIEQAKDAGADAIVTPCPLCHLSLDAWQSKLKKQTGKDFQMPILHLSQLIGVAAGLTDVSCSSSVTSSRSLLFSTVSRCRGQVSRPAKPDHMPRAGWNPAPTIDAMAAIGRLLVGLAGVAAVLLVYAWFEAGMASHPGARGACPGLPAASTGSASSICPTSISVLRSRAGAWRPSGPSRGRRGGRPTSCASPATSSPIPAASRGYGRCSSA